MSTTPDTLIAALQTADMLEIDDLHAWQFHLDSQQLAAPDASDAADQPLLSIECMDGRALRKWHFSLAQVEAARFDPASASWSIAGTGSSHQIRCFAAISGDNNEPADASNDD